MIHTTQTWKIGDCVEFMKEMEDNCIDLVITSPPYNFGGFNRDGIPSCYGCYDDNLSETDYRNWTKTYFSEIYRVLKPSGTFYLNMKGKYNDYNYAHPFWITEISNFKLLNVIIWNFPSGADVSKRKWYPRHEYIFMFIKTNQYYFNGDYSKLGDVWKINHVVNGSVERTPHPAQFPLKLVERLINSSSKEGDIVCDPFLGSGTTLCACRRTNRNGIGFELDPKWEKYYGDRCLTHTPPLTAYFVGN